MDVGTRVREHHEAAGMRQDQLAELCHVSRQTVSNWERNKTLPDIVSLKVMANELGTSVDALVGDDVPEIRRRADERARALAALFTANMLFSLFVEVSVTGSAWNLSPVFSTQGWAYLHCAVFGAWLIALVAFWRLTRHLELVNVYDLIRYLNEHPSRSGAALPRATEAIARNPHVVYGTCFAVIVLRLISYFQAVPLPAALAISVGAGAWYAITMRRRQGEGGPVEVPLPPQL